MNFATVEYADKLACYVTLIIYVDGLIDGVFGSFEDDIKDTNDKKTKELSDEANE